ncbi:DNA primase [Rhodoferax sp. 4810]|uniref:DNA primase n=1 Tax=Thiospirillum jenense TaxID=1653858 RepID=A0A839HQF7_9GAMM|nr:DNA primase [Thiospirillum jenense]MBB1077688.1 DNA primase [Rhodoferax jenense]MBB1127312.1 DNA primase [Thiospirillum jenense]
MASRITPDLKQQVLARTDLVELIRQRVPLKAVGQNFKACCPFHDDKTPSFHVVADKQFYYCFGCGQHGNAIDFLIAYDRLSFNEAVEELAARAGIVLTPADANDQTARVATAPLYAVLEQAAALYRQQLRTSPNAIAYLKQRGLTGAIAKHFSLGFAPERWDFLTAHSAFAQTDPQLLVAAGLLIARPDAPTGRRHYDRLRQRIIFPIRDRQGRVCGFGGRAIDGSEPKYLNSPETPVFHKGQGLYGLFEARQASRNLPYLLVVEGYLDVITLAQFGFPYTVAMLGTATTATQLRQLQLVASEVIFCFDGDRAGQAAAWKALKLALPLATGHHPIRFVRLPADQDPDSLLRHAGTAAFEQLLADAQPLSEVLFDTLLAQVNLATVEGRAWLATEATALINTVPAGAYQTLLRQRLSTLVGIKPTVSPPPHQVQSPMTPARLTLPQRAAALLLQQPQLVAQLPPDWPDEVASWSQLNRDDVRLLQDVLHWVSADPSASLAWLRERWRDDSRAALLQHLTHPMVIAHIPPAGQIVELIGIMRNLKQEVEKNMRRQLLSTRHLNELSPTERAQLRTSALSMTPADQDISVPD